ncbi:hypothetical protein D9M68_861130 [compost metagenome]
MELAPGMTGRWYPGRRYYTPIVDLRVQTEVEIDGLDVHALKVPWDALALAENPGEHFGDPSLPSEPAAS